MSGPKWNDFDSERIAEIPDERVRGVMAFVCSVMNGLATMDARSAGEVVPSLLATICNCHDDPVGMLDYLANTVRARLMLGDAEPQGRG